MQGFGIDDSATKSNVGAPLGLNFNSSILQFLLPNLIQATCSQDSAKRCTHLTQTSDRLRSRVILR